MTETDAGNAEGNRRTVQLLPDREMTRTRPVTNEYAKARKDEVSTAYLLAWHTQPSPSLRL